ncbi:MAG TPA: diacylglycerol kinase family protein [Opitutaceae bacterium]|nr:diacylglycerol kinase family protein [Opitutaceae bacterium]
MDIAVLHNPTAGDRELPRRKLVELLRAAGYRPRYFSLKEDAWKKRRALRGAKFVVVAGGDGSVRKAVLALHDRGVPLALLPLGTANNVCTSLGIEGRPKKLIARWAKARPLKLDLGVAKGPWGKKMFIESAGAGLVGRAIGIMGAVEATSEHRPKRREDRLHRDNHVLQALAHELQPVRLRVQEDDCPACSGSYLLLEIMNISRVGPRFELAPEADPSDGCLNIVSATVGEREQLKRTLAGSIEGKKRPVLARRKVRTVRIEFADGEFRLDDKLVLEATRKAGEPRKKVRIEISVRPKAVEILV